MSQHDGPGVQVVGPAIERGDEVLTPEALAFVAELQRRFGPRRDELLRRRQARWDEIARGAALDFLPETCGIREAEWIVAAAPLDLVDRRVEITGPP
jgi:malate synthase